MTNHSTPARPELPSVTSFRNYNPVMQAMRPIPACITLLPFTDLDGLWISALITRAQGKAFPSRTAPSCIAFLEYSVRHRRHSGREHVNALLLLLQPDSRLVWRAAWPSLFQAILNILTALASFIYAGSGGASLVALSRLSNELYLHK